MFSARAELAVDEASRASRKLFLEKGSQIARMTIRAGSTASVSRPSFRSVVSRTMVMPTRVTKSPRAPFMFSRNSCSAFTSPCSRAMIRPTWVLSMKLSETSWKWANMARRMSKITRWARREDSHSPTKKQAA